MNPQPKSKVVEVPPGTADAVRLSMQADHFFSDDQRRRLGELMEKWRAARDEARALPPDEQAELESLIDAEVRAAGERARAILSGRSA